MPEKDPVIRDRMNGSQERERPAMGKVCKRLVRMAGEGEYNALIAHEFITRDLL